jgi:hypothetical protein
VTTSAPDDLAAPATRTAEPRPPGSAELIKARDAADLLSVILNDMNAAKDLLADQIYRGNVRAFALKQWRARGASAQAIWKEGPPPDAVKKAPIRRVLLRPSVQLHNDRKGWNWAKGQFFVTVRRRPLTLQMMRGVFFFRKDFFNLAKVYGGHPGGRPTETESWNKFWLEIVRLANDGGLTSFGTQKALRKHVIDALGWSRPDAADLQENTLIKPVRLVWEQFVAPRRGG